jgi:plastocyanin
MRKIIVPLLSFLLTSSLAHAESVHGTIRYTGSVPGRTPIANVPPACAGAPIVDESLLVGPGGGLANVVVWIDNAALPSTGASNLTLTQKGCVFEPHVQVAVVGSKLTIGNNDNTLHTAHAYDGQGATAFNVATPTAGFTATRTLDTVGPLVFKCDAGHPWMSAAVYVLPHGFAAVSGADGSFSIGNLPPGTYTVKLWHEKLGTQTATITVGQGKDAQLDASFH